MKFISLKSHDREIDTNIVLLTMVNRPDLRPKHGFSPRPIWHALEKKPR